MQMLVQEAQKKISKGFAFKNLFGGALLGLVLFSGSMVTPAFADSDEGLTTELLTRVNQLEEQQRTMRGQLDDLTEQFQTKIDLLNKKLDDMQFAATNSGAAPPAAPPAPPAPAAVATKPAGRRTLKDGQAALLSGDYATSESIAKEIIGTPQGVKSVNAHFLLAQSLAGQKQYKQASLGYFDIYKKFPSSTRAPEALLGVGFSLIKNNDNKSACEALGLLNNKYPNAPENVKKAAITLKKRAKCS